MNRRIRLATITVILFLSSGLLLAQGGTVLGINAGYINPKDAKDGMLFGLTFGRAIDESVDIGLGIDVFHKTYTEESKVAQDNQQGLTTNTYYTSVEYSRTILPLNLMVDVKIPVGRYIGYYIRGGLSYELLFSKEKNYEINRSENRRYGGLGWQAAGGLYYVVGSRSTFLASVTYNSCEVSRSIEESTQGLPISERIDLSGLGFRVGVLLDIE
jgi:hypothetical protein